jgi:hypothetical protein
MANATAITAINSRTIAVVSINTVGRALLRANLCSAACRPNGLELSNRCIQAALQGRRVGLGL